jgi:type I restriction enzyme M protein
MTTDTTYLVGESGDEPRGVTTQTMRPLADLIWSIADLLRGDFQSQDYGRAILALTLVRRLDCSIADGPVGPSVAVTNQSGIRLEDLSSAGADLLVHLERYIGGYPPLVCRILDEIGFAQLATRLNRASLLRQTLERITAVDLSPRAVPNNAMGYLFEDLVRRFAEANAAAGEHFTPREVVHLMVRLLFEEDDRGPRDTAHSTIFDPACGTGGMLAMAREYVASSASQFQGRPSITLFGQELNPETWAIAAADLMLSGASGAEVALGNSLTADAFEGRTFDYMLANPPFGVDWRRIEAALRDEAARPQGRFSAGLPRVSDGALLFLQHMLSKMRPREHGGSRIAIVFPASPLFAGGAGSGESEIRRWIIENDWLEAVIALPSALFYNTSIPTYVWVLTNRKAPRRRGRVSLIDARDRWARMPRGLGEKRREMTEDDLDAVIGLYRSAPENDGPRSQTFENKHFGYRRLAIRLRPGASPEYENVPMSAEPHDYVARNIVPYQPEAKLAGRQIIGYEIPFTRVFYRTPDSLPLETIDERLAQIEEQLAGSIGYLQDAIATFNREADLATWRSVPLRRVVRLVNGGTPPRDSRFWDGPIPWATPVDLGACDGELAATQRSVTGDALQKGTRSVPSGSVLLSSRAPIGHVGVTTRDVAFSQGCKGLVPDHRIRPWCLAFQLLVSRQQLESLGQGSTFSELSAESLGSLRILLPPIDYQDAHERQFRAAISSFAATRTLIDRSVDLLRAKRRSVAALLTSPPRGMESGA